MNEHQDLVTRLRNPQSPEDLEMAAKEAANLLDAKPDGSPTRDEKAALLSVLVERLSKENGNERALGIARAMLKELSDAIQDDGLRASIREELDRGSQPSANADLIKGLEQMKSLGGTYLNMNDFGGIPIDTFIAALKVGPSREGMAAGGRRADAIKEATDALDVKPGANADLTAFDEWFSNTDEVLLDNLVSDRTGHVVYRWALAAWKAATKAAESRTRASCIECQGCGTWFDSGECPKCDGTGKSRARVLPTREQIARRICESMPCGNCDAERGCDVLADRVLALLTGGKTDG